jgi:hypothetical protein
LRAAVTLVVVMILASMVAVYTVLQ